MKLLRLAVLLACLLLILGPFLPMLIPADVTAHDFARSLQLPLLLLAALALAADRAPRPGIGRWTMALFAFLALLVSASAIHAAVPVAAWREIALFAALSAWSLMVARSFEGANARFWLGAVCLSQLLYGLGYVGLLVASLANHQPVLLWEMNFGYDNPRFLNHVQAATLPLLLGIAVQPGASVAIKAMSRLALVLQLFVLAASLGRSAMLGLVVAAVVVALVAGRAARRWLAVGAASALLAGLAYGALQSIDTSVQQASGYTPTTKELTSDHSRQYLWDIALADARGAPWLGVGPMHFAHEPNAKAAHPHNHYLQAAAELGWPALAILMVLVLNGLRVLAVTLRAEKNEDRQAVGCGLLGACVAIAVDACFSGNLVMPFSQIWIFSVMGMSIGWRHDGSSATTRPVISALAWSVLRTVFVLAAAWSCWVAYHEIQAPTPRLQTDGARAPSPTEVPRPRFWSHGWF
ncbi:MAG TPA: O-antigen ligase family protein [Dyella sp.]|uniref:O-antigen ligase family protein n=1 Tax=Dyella sp. TaxID=1869338 RepID=UPI002F91E122